MISASIYGLKNLYEPPMFFGIQKNKLRNLKIELRRDTIKIGT
jgi:hypothetical protein